MSPDGRSFARQLRVGGFIVAALGVCLAIIYLLGAEARYFERKYKLYAEFAEVGGLIDGATVRLAGVQIGRVTDVALLPEVGGKVRVTLTVARRFVDRIRRDSEARIVTQGLLGDRLVEISMGTPGAPALRPGDTIATRESFEIAQALAQGAETLRAVNRLAASLDAALGGKGGALEDFSATLKSVRHVAEQLDTLGRDGAFGEIGAVARSARRIVEQVEKGQGLLHAVIYDEPETLRRLNGLLASAQETLARTRDGQSAVAVLLSPESGKAARGLLAAMEALGRGAEKSGGDEGLLSALLYDPQYKSVAGDLQAVAHNFREVSDRLVKGRGLVGALLSDEEDGTMGQAAADFRAAMANLRTITDRLKAGEGTIGGLLEDPTVYENLAAFLEGTQRSFLLRALIRSSIGAGSASAPTGAASPGKAGAR